MKAYASINLLAFNMLHGSFLFPQQQTHKTIPLESVNPPEHESLTLCAYVHGLLVRGSPDTWISWPKSINS